MVAVAAGSAVAPRALLRPYLTIGIVCAVLPDIDAIGRPIYGAAGDIAALGGHRGFTHSITFAVLLGVAVASATLPRRRWDGERVRLGIFVIAATALHAVLDMFTTIGASSSPVQLLSPFSRRGYGVPWHSIDGLVSELLVCVIPLVCVTLIVSRARRGAPGDE
jgi:inner membrane protein